MIRKIPNEDLEGVPCSMVAVAMANDGKIIPVGTSKADGYMTLSDMNKYVRANLDVKKREDFKRGRRPFLRDMKFEGKAIVCVLGHYLYADKESYYSFFDNDCDLVVAVWYLK